MSGAGPRGVVRVNCRPQPLHRQRCRPQAWPDLISAAPLQVGQVATYPIAVTCRAGNGCGTTQGDKNDELRVTLGRSWSSGFAARLEIPYRYTGGGSLDDDVGDLAHGGKAG